MKKSLLLTIFLSLMNVFLPVIASSLMNNQYLFEKTEQNQENIIEEKIHENKSKNAIDDNITFKVQNGDDVIEISMNEYLPGVLAAEMPASFPLDALKAQAVAARSFILYRLANPPSDGVHDTAAICTNASHCKGFTDIMSPDISASLYGAAADIYVEKLCRAVQETDGEVMLYDNKPILAAFHSISGGKTENASDVWGGDVPYLCSVDSPGEEDAKKYESTVVYDAEEYARRLSAAAGKQVTGEPYEFITDIVRSESGGIINANVCGNTVKGTALRTALELNSTDFTVDYDNNDIVIHVKGYGHGVGMSQYGARAMALNGCEYINILTHYYTGAVLKKISQNEFDM